MPQFWRTYFSKIYAVKEVPQLGFPITDPSYIPNEYLAQGEFIILRTCFGLGDWGIISAFPRKLKEKYPDCKVYIPSPKLLREMFGQLESNWASWSDPFQVVRTIFDNNPYVDGFIDSFEGEVYNDHFRITDGSDTPLMEELLRFWQFSSFEDIEPELYFTEEENAIASKLIKKYTDDGRFGTLLISNRWETEDPLKVQAILDKYNLPVFYYEAKDVGLNYRQALNLKEVPTRIQLLLKTRATFNVGNQTGVNDTIANYAPTYTVKRRKLGSNIIRSQIYL